MDNILFTLEIQHNDNAKHIYQHTILYMDEYDCNCKYDLKYTYEFTYDGKYYICPDKLVRKKKYTLNKIPNVIFECVNDDINILNEILYITDFSSLRKIIINSFLISDYFLDFVIHTNNVDELYINVYNKFIITKKFIDMLLYKNFKMFSLLGIKYVYNKPKLIIKDIFEYLEHYIISDVVLSYMKDIVYEYYDISFFKLSNRVKHLATDFAQEKIE